MGEETITKAAERFLDGGASSGYALALMFLLAIVWLTHRLLKSQDAMMAEKDAHRETVSKLGPLVESVKNATNAQTETMKLLMDSYKERRP